jgi:Fe-S-cluster-containing hydrogenase component 2
MDAISAADGKYQLDVTRCIGCGLCVTTCPSGALRLRQKEKARIPPPNTVALYTRILQERYGPLGTAKAVAKRALGMKV